MKMGETFDPAMSRAQVHLYLERAGFAVDDALLHKVRSWKALQALVTSDSVPEVVAMPAAQTRLQTYGLEQDHPLALLARHVVG